MAKALTSWGARRVGSVRLQLAVARVVVHELDIAQESRALSQAEFDLRRELKASTLGLASLSRTIARQSSRCRFLKDGDANTRFFNIQACHRKRKSYIPTFQHGGLTFTTEEAKSGAIFDYYMGLLGTRFQRLHRIDLSRLNLPSLDLHTLEAEFTDEEVARVILESPLDRAPGPDGFTGRFYRVAWDVIKADICQAFRSIWAQDWRSFYLLNDACMVLMRKNDDPSGLNDYRPISLIHSFGKLVSKALALRLAPFMDSLVRPNQTAFIKGRRIHDNFRSVQLYCRWLHARHHSCFLLKVDIAKAFDSVAWPFLFEVMEHLGFPARWRDWIAAILSSASTKVIVNGRAGRRICHARGLRQGDPLSPMLFVLVLEVLNALIVQADLSGLLSPLPGSMLGPRLSLYADDLVIFLAPRQEDFICIRTILEVFAGASGLVTNVEKCCITPIRCTEDDVMMVQQVFPCRVAPFPARYLGAPLSVVRLRRADEQRLVDAVARRIPTWKAGLLNTAGRLTLTKATLSAIPVHVSITCCLSPWAIKQIDKSRRAFLWCGTSTAVGGKCRVAWPIVCSPKCYGGLGMIDIRVLGLALRLRWEWQRRAPDAPVWTKLPHKPEKLISAMFNCSVRVELGDGTSARFWTDPWLPDGRIAAFAPHLFRAVGRRFHCMSVKEALSGRRWVRHITGPYTAPVLCDYVELWAKLEDIQLQPLVSDRFVWRWTNDGSYSAASAYRSFFVGMSSMLGAKQVWQASAPPKIKLFFWLALHGRIWTSERRRRHGLQDHAECALCNQEDETVDHLLVACVFSRELWHCFLHPLGWGGIAPRHGAEVASWWMDSRGQVPPAFRKGFDSAVLLLSWLLWKERNSRTFDHENSTVTQVARRALEEADQWVAAGFSSLSVFMAATGPP